MSGDTISSRAFIFPLLNASSMMRRTLVFSSSDAVVTPSFLNDTRKPLRCYSLHLGRLPPFQSTISLLAQAFSGFSHVVEPIDDNHALAGLHRNARRFSWTGRGSHDRLFTYPSGPAEIGSTARTWPALMNMWSCKCRPFAPVTRTTLAVFPPCPRVTSRSMKKASFNST